MTDAASNLAAEQLLVGRQRRDPSDIRDRLMPWLRQRFPEADEIDLSLPVAPPGGGSSESFFITPEIRAGSDIRRLPLVVRIEPRNHRIYEQRSIERQYATMKRLRDLGVVPVPAMWFLEADPSILGEAFLVMERVDGVVPHDRYHAEGLLLDATPAERLAIWTSLLKGVADIHASDPAEFSFLDRPEFGSTPVEQELAIWESYIRWLGREITPWQLRAAQWLRDNVPSDIVPGLSWGDARLPNTIFQGDVCRAFLDWETVSLCGAENDLAWMLFYDWFVTEAMGVERLPGIPDRDETLQIWASFAGREPRSMRWHDIAAILRFSLLRDRSLDLAGLKSAPFMISPDPLMLRFERLAVAGSGGRRSRSADDPES